VLSCSHYDLIEIACLYHFDIELHYADRSVRGIAKDTQKRQTDQSRPEEKPKEGIVLMLENTLQLAWFSLENLTALTAHTQNRYFNHVEFNY
jgi:Rho-binding antiterminator